MSHAGVIKHRRKIAGLFERLDVPHLKEVHFGKRNDVQYLCGTKMAVPA
jgi:hypothetical protein